MDRKTIFIAVVIFLLALFVYWYGDRLYAYLLGFLGCLSPVVSKLMESIMQFLLSLLRGKKAPSITQTGEINIANSNVGSIVLQDGKLFPFSHHILSREASLPPLLDYSIRRQKLLGEILNKFVHSEASKLSLALVGIGGSGKTILANQLLREKECNPFSQDGILWEQIGPELQGEDSAFSIMGEWLKKFGHAPESFVTLEARQAQLRGIFSNKRIAIVLDDVWVVQPAKNLLSCCASTTSVIITTRVRDLPMKLGFSNSVAVSGLEVFEAKELVERRQDTKIPDEEWQSVVAPFLHDLGMHALAISLAAAQVTLSGKAWSDLRNDWISVDKSLEIGFSDTVRREESVSLTLKVSIDQLGPIRSERFAFLAVLAQGHKFSIIDAANILPDLPSTSERNILKADVRELSSKDLIEIEGELNRFYLAGLLEVDASSNSGPMYYMHPLVGDCCIAFLKQKGLYETAIALHTFHYSRLLSEAATNPNEIGLFFYYAEPQIRLLLVRATEILKSAQDKNERAFYFNYFIETVNSLADFWLSQGQATEALKWQRIALGHAKAAEPVDNDTLLHVILDLTRSLQYLHLFPEANALQNEALAIAQNIGSLEWEAKILNAIGTYLLDTHEPGEAILVFNRSLEIWKKLESEEEVNLLNANIGQAYMLIGDFDKAISFQEQAIVKAGVNEASRLGKRYGNLAYVYQQKALSLLNNSVPMLIKSLVAARSYGDLPGASVQMMRLSEVHRILGFRKVAKAYAEDAFEILEGINHPDKTAANRLVNEFNGEAEPIDVIQLPEIYLYVREACLGDRALRIKTEAILNSVLSVKDREGFAELASIADALLMVLKGERDLEKILSRVAELEQYNFQLLLLDLTDPEYHMLVVQITHILRAFFLSQSTEAEKSIQSVINFLEDTNHVQGFNRTELANSLRAILAGERDFDSLKKRMEGSAFSGMFAMFEQDRDIMHSSNISSSVD